MDTPLFVAALAVLAVLAGFWLALLIGQERERRRRVLSRASGLYGQSAEPGRLEGGLGRMFASLRDSLVRLGQRFEPKESDEVSQTRLMLIRAGLRKASALSAFWGAKIGLALVGLGAAAALHLTLLRDVQGQLTALAYLSLPGLGLYLPNIWLSRRVEWRKKAIRNALPDALDLLVVCVEAGMGLNQAIYRVSLELAEGYPVLADELKLLNLELRAGKARRDALKDLAHRVGLDDVNSLVALLVQSELFGTSVAQTLRVYADAMRTKRFQLAEEQAGKLPVKMLLPLILCILPPLFVIIIGPGAMRLISILTGVQQ